jgi:hypothetical protein
VDDALARFADARVREFVPVLVEKQARDRLRRDRPAPAADSEEPSTNGHRIET